MALIDKETICKEIERRIENCVKNVKHLPCHRIEELCELLGFLDSLPEQPKLKPMNIPSGRGRMGTTPPSFKLDVKPERPELPGIEKEGIPGKDFIPVEWVDACERYGKWKIVQKVKSASEELEEEIAGMYQALFGTDIINRKEMLYLETFHNIARHFAEWGAIHLNAKKEQ